jgi:hypothetical protein
LTFDTAVISGEEWNSRVKNDYRPVASLNQWAVQYGPGA